MPIPGNLLTTAMAVMPHTNVDRALETALSFDIYTNAGIISSYTPSIRRFLDRGGVIVWGIVPTGFETFEKENIPSLIHRLEETWQALTKKGIDMGLLLEKSLLSPATCCLVNPDREKTVEKAFETIKLLSEELREKYLHV